jgi:hypothetical protein
VTNLPPTVQRQASPPAQVAPYALVTVHASPEARLSDVRPLLERWTGDGVEHTHSWGEFAAAHRLVGYDEEPFFQPDYAYCGRHRWVAITEEAPNELHVYAGLCGRSAESLPDVGVVADRARDLIQFFGEWRLQRGSQRVRLRVLGSMYVRGSCSGHEYHPPQSYFAIFREGDTLKEAIPLFAASYGGLFASGPANRLPLSSYSVTLAIGMAAYCFLAWMRWTAESNQAKWTSTGWPQ